MTHQYYSIVTFGRPSYGAARDYYRSIERAIADTRGLGGGSCTTVRVVGCASRAEALAADVSGPHPVVWAR